MLHLAVKTRDKAKKAKEFLKEGYIPAVVYGPKTPSTSLAVKYKEFFNTHKEAGETTLIALDIDLPADLSTEASAQAGASVQTGEKTGSEDSKEEDASKTKNVVLIRDVQIHPVSGNFIHIDFYQLPLDQEIEISVPVLSEGVAPAVKEQGGILVHNLHEINIKALPIELIHEIKVDLSGLENIGDSILVKDLKTSQKIEVLADEEEMVFTIEEPREEEVEEVEETETEEETIEGIKTEGEEKREEEATEEEGETVPGVKKEEMLKQEEGKEGKESNK